MTPQQQIAEEAEKYANVMVWINKGKENEHVFHEYISETAFTAGANYVLNKPTLFRDRLEDILDWLYKENLIMSHGGLYQLVDKYIDHLNEKK